MEQGQDYLSPLLVPGSLQVLDTRTAVHREKVAVQLYQVILPLLRGAATELCSLLASPPAGGAPGEHSCTRTHLKVLPEDLIRLLFVFTLFQFLGETSQQIFSVQLKSWSRPGSGQKYRWKNGFRFRLGFWFRSGFYLECILD